MMRLAACLALILSMVLLSLPASAQEIDLKSREIVSISELGIHKVLTGTNWLGGNGVDVYYYKPAPCDQPGVKIREFSTYAFECVDLAVRLYAKVGYKNFREPDKPPIGAAKDLVDADKFQAPRNGQLRFYKNGSADRPPAPGDLLVFEASAQNGYFGHVAVVNWVAGDTLGYVQQNVCSTGEGLPEPYGLANLEVELDNGKQLFSITTDLGSWGSVAGWVHSDLIKQQLIDQPEMRRAGDIRWNRDDTAVYVYLSPARTRALANGAFIGGVIADLLDSSGALSFTTYELAAALTEQVGEWIRSDRRLNPASGVRSVDFTLKYTGRMIWVRPWGGPANGKWIPFVMPDQIRPFRAQLKTSHNWES
jgi:hypothetical protein